MRKLDDIQLYICGFLMVLLLWGLQQDIFNLGEGIAGFIVALIGFIDAGIRLILAD